MSPGFGEEKWGGGQMPRGRESALGETTIRALACYGMRRVKVMGGKGVTLTRTSPPPHPKITGIRAPWWSRSGWIRLTGANSIYTPALQGEQDHVVWATRLARLATPPDTHTHPAPEPPAKGLRIHAWGNKPVGSTSSPVSKK